MRLVRRALRKASFLWNLVAYDLFVGTRRGIVLLNRNIAFAPDVRVCLGERVHLGRNGVVQGSGSLEIGARTYVGNFFDFNVHAQISIGEDCMLANFVSIVDNNHGMAAERDMRVQPIVAAPVSVERNCWIGEKAVILAGVHIGEGAVVAAGAVVTKDVPPCAVVGGVPARVLRYRDDAKERKTAYAGNGVKSG